MDNERNTPVDGIILDYDKRYDDDQKRRECFESKAEALYITIKAKNLLEKRLYGEIDDADLAYELAQDPKLCATTSNLVQQILHPTDIEVVHGRPDQFIDVVGGVTTFWKEINKEIPIKLDNAVAVENIIMCVNSGLDKSMDPDTRKKFLTTLGFSDDRIKEFITLQDYVMYEENSKDAIRLQVMEDLGITSEELSEDEELMVETMTNERAFTQKLQIDDENSYEPTYEEIYAMSAQKLHDIFSTDKEDTPLPENGENVSVDDEEWAHIMDMCGAEDAYYDMLNASVEENVNELYENLFTDTSLDFGNTIVDTK